MQFRRSIARYSADGQAYTVRRAPLIGCQDVCDIALSDNILQRQVISAITINNEEFTNVPMYEWVALDGENYNGRWFTAGGHYYVLFNADQTGGGWRVVELLEMPLVDENNNVILLLKYIIQDEDIEIEIAQIQTDGYLSPVSFEISIDDAETIRFSKYEKERWRTCIFSPEFASLDLVT